MVDISQHIEEPEPLSRQLIGAINTQNFDRLKTLLASNAADLGAVKLVKDCNEDTLLHVAVRKKNLEILEYIINLGAIEIDTFNALGKTPLLMAAIQLGPEIIKLLIDKGADLNLADAEGNTPLHYAAYYNLCDNCLILLENGANVDAQNNQGYSVLHTVCGVHKNSDLVALLMYFGADISVASWDDMGCTPFEMCLILRKVQFQNFLVDYVFDETVKVAIQLVALAEAMQYNCDLFPQLVENISEVIYDVDDLEIFMNKIICCEPTYLKLFIKHFDYIIKEITCLDNPLNMSLGVYVDKNITNLQETYLKLAENLYTIFSAPVAPYFIENINKNLDRSFLGALVTIYQRHNLPKEQLSHLILHLLSHGAILTDTVLDQIYDFYGDSDLFRTLLHMDIKQVSLYVSRSPFPRIIYDVSLQTIDEFLREPNLYDSIDLDSVVQYFGGVKVKRICANATTELVEKSRQLPDVPSLLELARNAARNHIIAYYGVTTSRQLYTFLKRLPINNEYKAIIAFQRRLYCLK